MLLFLWGGNAFSQTIEEKKKQADEYFEAGLYIEATKLYSAVLTDRPRDYEINFKYGTCLLFSSHNKEEAIRYLAYSVKSPSIDKRAYYFLGRAYHLNYQFKEAEAYYQKFKEQASTSQLKEYNVEAQLNACKYGRKLLSDVTDMIVMKKTEIKEESFYDLYDMNNIGGSILVTDRFGTKYDKKVEHRSVIHFPANSPNIFYSSYGDDGATGLDIYQKKKLPDGSYSLPQKVRGQVNTDLDEDYAYMDPNGKYLYFCSKGHNSMGGYDVFRSEYDPKRDAFGPPENMDFAISSPDDDMMYVVDSLGRVAFFASRRESQDGKIFVYEVRVERIPMQIAAIKGSFVNSIVSSNKEINIVIEDFSSGKQIGTYNSKANNGDYFISFPKGGKYKYFMTVKGSDVTHYAVVEVPTLKELRPLKQRISLLRDDAGEQVIQIDNLFDEEFDDPVTVMAEIYRELALLSPNSENFDLDSLDATQKVDQVFAENGMDAFSTKEDVIHILEEEIADLDETIQDEEEMSNIAYNLAEEKSNQANEKMIEVNKIMDQADKTSDPNEKKELYEEAYKLNKKVEILNDDAQNLVNLGQQIDIEVQNKKNKLNNAKEILDDVKQVDKDDRPALASTVQKNTDFFQENVVDKSDPKTKVEQIVEAGTDKANKANEINGEIIALSSERQELLDDQRRLEKQLEGTKKKKDREEIESKILDIGSDLNIIIDQIEKKEQQYDQVLAEEGAALTGVAEEVSDDNYKNSTYSNNLSKSEKDNISSNVKSNDLSDNVDQINKTLKDSGAGSKVELFASDEKRENYSLDQWNEEIDKEIVKLQDQLNKTPLDKQGPILEEIKEYEDLKEQKKKEFDVVETDPNDIKPDVNKNEIIDDYADRKNQIDQIEDQGDRTNANLRFNQELKDEIQDEKNRLNELLDENPDSDNIKNRIKNLEEIEDEIDNEIDRDKQWLADNGTPVRSNDEIVDDFDSDYQKKVNEIYQITDEGERDSQMRDLNNSILANTNERIQEVDAILENDPENKQAQSEKDELVAFRDKLESNLEDPLVDPVVVDADNIEPKVSKDQFIKNYSTKESDILGIDDEHEKREAEIELDEQLSGLIRNEIEQLSNILKDDPGNKNAKKRLDNLKKLDDEVNKRIVENKEWLTDNPKVETVEIVADVSDVNNGYQDRMNEIGEIEDEKDRKDAIKELNNETVDNINKRLNEIDSELQNDPENAGLNGEKESLTNLKDKIEQNPEVALLSPQESITINTAPSVTELMPEYNSRMNTIDASPADDVVKEEQRIEVNKDLVSKIDSELSRLTNLKTSRPDLAADIDQRIDGLKKIKSDKQNDIASAQDVVDNAGGGVRNGAVPSRDDIVSMSTSPSIAEISSDYQDKMDGLKLNSDLSVQDREQSKIDLNNDLIGKIDSEIAQLNRAKEEYPDLTAKIDGRIDALNNIKSAKQNENVESQRKIDNANDVANNTTNNNTNSSDLENLNEFPTIADIYPEYEPQFDQIMLNSDQNEVSKEQAKIDLNKQLISKIDSEINNLENLKSSNPSFASKIDNRFNALNDIKSKKQADIESSQAKIDAAGTTANNNTTDNNTTDNNTTDNNTTDNNTSVDLDNLSAIPTVDEIYPGYTDKLDNIGLAQQDESTKAANKIDLNNQLIAKIDQELSKMEGLSGTNPDYEGKINSRIEALKNMKSAKLAEIDKDKQLLDGADVNRPEITIGSLMPNYEPEMTNIQDNPDLSQQERLIQENELNTSLISAIDNKISDLQEEWEENPELNEVISEEIAKLEELKESKRSEIARNNEILGSAGGTDVSDNQTKNVGELTQDDFNTTEGKNVIADHQGTINDINDLDGQIKDLEVDRDNAEDPNDKAKIQKQIDKLNSKKAKLENEVLTDLADANNEEYNKQMADTQNDALLASSSGVTGDDVLDANSDLERADQLMQEAADLRKDAAKEKDPIAANEMLKMAVDKENQAKELVQNAGRTYKTAKVVNNMNKDREPVITEVPENPSDRISNDYFTEADNLDLQANGLADRANELRDSANTVKKKYKQAIINQADDLDKQAGELRSDANDLRDKGNKIKAQEDEVLAVQLTDPDKDVDEETKKDLASTDDYKEFHEANKSAKENMDKANEIGDEIEKLKNQQKRQIKAAVVNYSGSGDVEDVAKNDTDVQATQKKIDQLTEDQKRYKDQALNDLEEANNILDRAGDKVRDDFIAMSNDNVEPQDKVEVATVENSLYEAPQVVVEDIFKTTDTPVYNETNRIPVDQKTNGLVYKVQVGAFRKPLPQDHFKEFAPISGQKINDGITRYMVGYFTKEATANDARGQIRGIGYGDAFVVAYCNGERISIREAREIEAGTRECVGTVLDEQFVTNNTTDNNTTDNNTTDNNTTDNNTTDNNTTDNNTVDNNTTDSNTTDNNTTNTNTNNNTTDNATVTPNNTEERDLVSYYTQFPNAAKATQVEIVKGLFFTVQIGVYSRPVGPSTLFNIQPLNSQKLPNGTIRYSTGMFTSVGDATTRKNEVIGIGVQDAFVTAYFNGERITIAEANRILQEQGASALYNQGANAEANFGDGGQDTSDGGQDTSDGGQDTSDGGQDTSDGGQDSSDGGQESTAPDSDIFNTSREDNGPPYRINLGFFQGEVPVEFLDLLLNNQNDGILSVSDIQDNILYFVGTYDSRSGAEGRRDEMISKGFNDAYIVSVKKQEDVVDEVKFYPEGVYYRVLLGKYKGEIPGEYATIMLQTEDLVETEEDIEGTTYLLSTKLPSMDGIEDRLKEFSELGFEDMEIVAYYQYDAIPFLQAQKILKEEPIGKLQRYEHHEGIDADPYLYNKEAVYFHIEVGRFYKEIPADFTNLLFENEDENILREETFDEELVFFTENIYDYYKAEEELTRLKGKGFKKAKIVAFHKYDTISIAKAKKILGIQ